MAKAQFKLLLFLLTVGVTAGTFVTAYWFYERVIKPEMELKETVKKVASAPVPLMDPGVKRFEAAVEELRAGRLDSGRDALYQLLRQFPESPTCAEAKRIISQINLDRLFSPNYLEGKVDYRVQPGGSLTAIASKHQTTLDMILRMNALRGSVIHAGDQLLLVPLDFDFVVKESQKTVTILRQGKFFAEFEAVEVRLPSGMRLPVELKLGTKSASLGGKSLAPTDPGYMDAQKWLPSNRTGVVFRPESDLKKEEAEPVAGAPASVPEPGIFMNRYDLEEVFALARAGAMLSVVK